MSQKMHCEFVSWDEIYSMCKELAKTVGLPAVAVASAAGEQIVAAIKRMPTAVARNLGVDSWR